MNGANGERQNTTVFDLITVCSSNTDFRTVIFNEKAVASGEIMRLIQLRIEQDNTLTKSEADDIFGKLLHNYGHAGEIFAQYLGTGTITLNPLPKKQGYGRQAWGKSTKELRMQPSMHDESEYTTEVLARDMELMFDDVLSSLVGKILVM